MLNTLESGVIFNFSVDVHAYHILLDLAYHFLLLISP